MKDSARHVVLGTQQFKPNEFASQINLSMENAWGILRCVIDICRKLDEGKYLILKDPNKVSHHKPLFTLLENLLWIVELTGRYSGFVNSK